MAKAVKKTISPEAQIKQLIKSINDADQQQVESQFAIANMLTAIRDHKLHEFAGYSNFRLMVRGEFNFSDSTANSFVQLYNAYTDYRYNKDEFLKLMQQFGWRKLLKALLKERKKIGYRKVKQSLAEMAASPKYYQMNVLVKDKELKAKLDSILYDLGMEESEEHNYRFNVSTAFEKMINEYEHMRKQQFATKSKSKQLKRAS